MFKNTLVVLLLVAGVACVKSRTDECKNVPQYQVLTTSAKLWLPYSNNKSLSFENIAQQRDTLDVLKLFIGDDSVFVGDKCPITRGQFVRADFFDKKSKDTIRTQLGFQDELRIFTKSTNLLYYDTRTVLIDPTPFRKFDFSVTL